jgi:hypothetical protein
MCAVPGRQPGHLLGDREAHRRATTGRRGLSRGHVAGRRRDARHMWGRGSRLESSLRPYGDAMVDVLCAAAWSRRASQRTRSPQLAASHSQMGVSLGLAREVPIQGVLLIGASWRLCPTYPGIITAPCV